MASSGVGPDDRIVPMDRSRDEPHGESGDLARSTLVSVRLPRGEVRELTQRPVDRPAIAPPGLAERVTRSRDDAAGRIEGCTRSAGYAPDAAGKTPPAPLDRLLPPVPETEAVWRGRRAATEVAIDPGLRFLRFQDMVIPDAQPGNQPFNAMGLYDGRLRVEATPRPRSGPGPTGPAALRSFNRLRPGDGSGPW